MALIDFTLSNARRFYSSMENPLGVKGLRASILIKCFVFLRLWTLWTEWGTLAHTWYGIGFVSRPILVSLNWDGNLSTYAYQIIALPVSDPSQHYEWIQMKWRMILAVVNAIYVITYTGKEAWKTKFPWPRDTGAMLQPDWAMKQLTLGWEQVNSPFYSCVFSDLDFE